MQFGRILAMNQKVRASKAQVFNETIETYFDTTRSAEVKSLIAEIRSTDDTNKRRQLKSQLPFRCPHYFSFKDGRRAQANIIPEEFTFQTCVDIDDMSQVEQALSRAYIINTNEGEWQGMLLHAERSASGKLHLDIRLPIGMTIEEAQQAYTKALGVDFDSDCCSPERMIYISDAESQLYTSESWYARLSEEELAARRKAYTDRGLTIDGREPSSPKSGEARRGLNEGKTPAAEYAIVQTTPTPPNLGGERDYPADYMGVPYSYIVEELADQLHLLAAPMSIGKSSIKEPINHILQPIIERDKLSRQREKEWAEETNTKGANKEKPERPKDICVQVVDSDMTNAAFCQRMEDAERAGNKALFTRMDEMEQLKKLAGGSMSEVTEILRRDFDADVYGQERVGTQSVKTRTTMRYNIVISTTPATAKKFLGSNIDNGTLSRFSLATIVKEDVDHRPMFKPYDEIFDKKLGVYLARLDNAKGTIVCPQAKKLALALLDRGEERALMMGTESYEQLSYRAVEIAFRKSILLYIMNGMKWTKEIEDFITWAFDYDLWVKMCILGEEISTKLEQDYKIMRPGVSCILEQLGDSFTRQEFELLYRSQSGSTADFRKASSNLLSQWRKRGWIEEDKAQGIFYKTDAYYQKHAA